MKTLAILLAAMIVAYGFYFTMFLHRDVGVVIMIWGTLCFLCLVHKPKRKWEMPEYLPVNQLEYE